MGYKTKNIVDLDQKVKCITLALRTKISTNDPLRYLACISDYYKFKNHLYSRLRIALYSNGCSFALCTMCPIPNEASNPDLMKITVENYINQVKLALKEYSNQEIIAIYCENFFSEYEIPKEANQAILNLVKETKCKYLLIGAHPIFITREKLKAAYDILGDQTKLIIGLGLQSANDEIRKTCIRTPLTREVFLKAHKIIQEFGYSTKSYILLKPPFLLHDEAIKDTVESVVWLHEQSISDDITICPTRIAKGTVLRDLFDKNIYSQPKLAALVECLYQIQQKKMSARVSLSSSDAPELETIMPSGCEICKEKILRALREYNNLKQVDFEKLRCPHCIAEEKKHDPKEFYNLSFQERVAYWLKLTETS
ncbi:MAG TPA: hypothetical protein DCZ38_05065 [Coxiellaceae bacterium]|nr:hypothetical protein [Coxiellaceae bacterium]